MRKVHIPCPFSVTAVAGVIGVGVITVACAGIVPAVARVVAEVLSAEPNESVEIVMLIPWTTVAGSICLSVILEINEYLYAFSQFVIRNNIGQVIVA